MRTFVIHAKSETSRKERIDSELNRNGIRAEFVLDGDWQEINKQVLEKYFSGSMKIANSRTSCALKHLIAYERIVLGNIDIALILENDIELYSNFRRIIQKSIEEIKSLGLKGILVSYEDSLLRYINRSARKSGKFLYPKDQGRAAGAYLVDYSAAKSILDYAEHKK